MTRSVSRYSITSRGSKLTPIHPVLPYDNSKSMAINVDHIVSCILSPHSLATVRRIFTYIAASLVPSTSFHTYSPPSQAHCSSPNRRFTHPSTFTAHNHLISSPYISYSLSVYFLLQNLHLNLHLFSSLLQTSPPSSPPLPSSTNLHHTRRLFPLPQIPRSPLITTKHLLSSPNISPYILVIFYIVILSTYTYPPIASSYLLYVFQYLSAPSPIQLRPSPLNSSLSLPHFIVLN